MKKFRRSIHPDTEGRYNAADHRSCLPIFESNLSRENSVIMNVLPLVKLEIMRPDESVEGIEWEKMFWNMNIPDDRVSAQAKLRLSG